MDEAKAKMIRFIDSHYNTLFLVPDGGNIVLTYSDGRKLTRPCTYVDETHVQIGINIYHICEFAKKMECIGASYAPEKNTPAPEYLGPEVGIKARSVPMGLTNVNRRTVDGYVLTNGMTLLESERDPQGWYFDGAGIDGMYLKTSRLFAPVLNEFGEIRAFREVLSEPVKARKPPMRGGPER